MPPPITDQGRIQYPAIGQPDHLQNDEARKSLQLDPDWFPIKNEKVGPVVSASFSHPGLLAGVVDIWLFDPETRIFGVPLASNGY